MQNNASIKRNLGQKIKDLAKAGWSYRKIKRKLGCSKGTISYHLGKGQKKKALARQADCELPKNYSPHSAMEKNFLNLADQVAKVPTHKVIRRSKRLDMLVMLSDVIPKSLLIVTLCYPE